MAHRVGDYLKHDPLKLRFTSSNPQTGLPKAVIRRSLNQSVTDITQINYYSQQPSVIVFYELLDISIVELETKKSLKVTWTGRQNKEEQTYPFLLPKTSNFGELSDHVSKAVKIPPGGSGKIRIFQIDSSGRAQKTPYDTDLIGNLSETTELFAEVRCLCPLLCLSAHFADVHRRRSQLKRSTSQKIIKRSTCSTTTRILLDLMAYRANSSSFPTSRLSRQRSVYSSGSAPTTRTLPGSSFRSSRLVLSSSPRRSKTVSLVCRIGTGWS